jgi:hypothetical protein
MKMSRRETMQLSATALAGLSLAGLKPGEVAAQAAPQPDGLVDTKLRQISTLPLNPDGSAVEYTPQEAGAITGVLWRTKNKTPEGEYDVRKMKIKVDGRGTAKLSGTLTFDVLEKAAAAFLCGAAAMRRPEPARHREVDGRAVFRFRPGGRRPELRQLLSAGGFGRVLHRRGHDDADAPAGRAGVAAQ